MLLSFLLCCLHFSYPVLGVDDPPRRNPTSGRMVLQDLEQVWDPAFSLTPATGDEPKSDIRNYFPSECGTGSGETEYGKSWYGWDNSKGNLGVLRIYENAFWITNMPRDHATKTLNYPTLLEIFKKAWGSKEDYTQSASSSGLPWTYRWAKEKEDIWVKNKQHREGRLLLTLVMTTWSGRWKDDGTKQQVQMAKWVEWTIDEVVKQQAVEDKESNAELVVVAPRHQTATSASTKRYMIGHEKNEKREGYIVYFGGDEVVRVSSGSDPEVIFNRQFYYMQGFEPEWTFDPDEDC